MIYLKIAITSVVSAAVLFLITKLIGYRQISEMSAYDYINSITIGSIAAEMAVSSGKEFLIPLEAMIIFGLIAFLLSLLTDKSIHIRRFVEGNPIVLMEKGKIYNESLKKSHIDINEFLVGCRNSGYFDISKLDTVILETNGKMSFIPKEVYRPLTPIDENLNPTQEKLSLTVICDGKIIEENLKILGYDESFLLKQIASRGFKDTDNVFLASLDETGNFSVFSKVPEKSEKRFL